MRFNFRGQSALFTKPTTTYSKKKKKFGPTALFTFKNYFVTVFSVFNKISCLQTNPKKHHPTNNQKNLKKKVVSYIQAFSENKLFEVLQNSLR